MRVCVHIRQNMRFRTAFGPVLVFCHCWCQMPPLRGSIAPTVEISLLLTLNGRDIITVRAKRSRFAEEDWPTCSWSVRLETRNGR